MTEHSKTVGSSTAGRVIGCPYSYSASKDIPNIESNYAAEGTMLHQVMDDILNGKDERECIGYEHENGHVCTEALFDEMIVPALQAFDDTFPDAEYITETKVIYQGIPGSFGRSDVTGTFFDENGNKSTFICDWKFGRGVEVSAENNKQLLFCASAGWETTGTGKFFAENRPIVGAIIQPAMGGVTTWVFGESELNVFETVLNEAWKDANTDNPRICEGQYCKFCLKKPSCPLKMDKLKKLHALGEMNLPEKSTLTAIPEPSVGMSITDRLDLSDIVEDWAKGVKSEAHARLEAGEVIKGYKLIAKRATRKWDNEDEAAKFLKGMKCQKDEIFPRKLVSIPQAEKLIKKKSAGKKKAMTIRMKTLEKHTVKVSSGNTLAHESNSSPAIVVTGALDKLEELKS